VLTNVVWPPQPLLCGKNAYQSARKHTRLEEYSTTVDWQSQVSTFTFGPSRFANSYFSRLLDCRSDFALSVSAARLDFALSVSTMRFDFALSVSAMVYHCTVARDLRADIK
jgi:hypothetical protein